MTVYVATLTIIAFFALLTWPSLKTAASNEKASRFFSALVGVLLIVVLALRDHTVGTDLEVYVRVWAAAETIDLFEHSRFEPAFIALTEISRAISDSPQFFITIVAIVSIAPVAYVILRHSSRPLLSWTIYICLGFYAFTFSGLRQAIAMAITTLAIHFIIKGKLLSFLIATSIASTFHISALIFLPAYWIYRVRLGTLGTIGYIILLPILFIFREPIFREFTERFYSSFEVVHSSAYDWLLLSGIIVFFCWIRLYQAPANDTLTQAKITGEARGLLQLSTVGVTLMLFASVGTNVMRMADYYYTAILLVLPLIVNTFPTRTRNIFAMGLGGALVIIYAIRMSGSPYDIVPYSLFME